MVLRFLLVVFNNLFLWLFKNLNENFKLKRNLWWLIIRMFDLFFLIGVMGGFNYWLDVFFRIFFSGF